MFTHRVLAGRVFDVMLCEMGGAEERDERSEKVSCAALDPNALEEDQSR